ncbi:MAG: bifunctional hydroxymethylpyrimidine kinase/phosphomethylpyrimidine kinase [Candidatus Latescibacterota bacterium]|nr:MAG: bifunctional hydroxymethylpyrimidine kinase/phosphomethylpyrimidine kinase [Candidatus Latescibacterota bacterium]
MSGADTRGRLATLLEAFATQRIAVVGDLALDEFVQGRTARISREAPVLILRHEQTTRLPGCAGNAARNVAALGGHVAVVGSVGDDAAGTTLQQLLEAGGIETRGVVEQSGGSTWCKSRFLAGDLHTVHQQVMRLDHEPSSLHDERHRHQLHAAIDLALRDATGVLLCDYGGGVLDAATRAHVLGEARRRELPVVADSRYALQEFAGVTCATPNETEIEPILGCSLGNAAAVESAGEELRRRLEAPCLIVTRGKLGMTVFDGGAAWHLSAYGGDAVDVAGAGDTVAAAVTLALSAQGQVRDAARLANYAASRVVLERGTAITSRADVRACMQRDPEL